MVVGVLRSSCIFGWYVVSRVIPGAYVIHELFTVHVPSLFWDVPEVGTLMVCLQYKITQLVK